MAADESRYSRTMKPFRAFRVFEDGGEVHGKRVEATLDELTPGDVVIKAAYSSVNYKDAARRDRRQQDRPALSADHRHRRLGHCSVERPIPASVRATRRWSIGYELGVSHDGGYAECVRVPAEWVVPLPPGLSSIDAMAIGTAGLTAALSIARLERNGLKPSNGPVIVTGATGGVGSVAVQSLRRHSAIR